MKRKVKQLALILSISLLISFTTAKVYAQTTGIDIISLAKNKIAWMLNMNTFEASTDIESQRKTVEDNTIKYVDDYIKGVDLEIKAYTDEQKAIANDKLEGNFNDIKKQLDSTRQESINNAKEQIKQIIDQKYAEEQLKLTEELNKKITEKLK